MVVLSLFGRRMHYSMHYSVNDNGYKSASKIKQKIERISSSEYHCSQWQHTYVCILCHLLSLLNSSTLCPKKPDCYDYWYNWHSWNGGDCRNKPDPYNILTKCGIMTLLLSMKPHSWFSASLKNWQCLCLPQKKLVNVKWCNYVIPPGTSYKSAAAAAAAAATTTTTTYVHFIPLPHT